jgi:hypothetical protein
MKIELKPNRNDQNRKLECEGVGGGGVKLKVRSSEGSWEVEAMGKSDLERKRLINRSNLKKK